MARTSSAIVDYLTAAQTPRSDAGRRVSVAEAKDIALAVRVSRTLSAGDRAAIVALLRGDACTPAARKVLEALVKPPNVDLGQLDEPSLALAGKTFTLRPGQTLVFVAAGNPRQSIGALRGTGVALDLRPERGDAQLGGQQYHRQRVTVPSDARAGQVFHLKTTPTSEARHDPRFNFSLAVRVGG